MEGIMSQDIVFCDFLLAQTPDARLYLISLSKLGDKDNRMKNGREWSRKEDVSKSMPSGLKVA